MPPLPTIAIVFAAGLVLLLVLSRVLPATFLAARRNERSNHAAPARQIGGFGVAPVTVGALLLGAALEPGLARLFLCLAGALVLLFLVGWVDDARDLPPAPKLLGQFAAVVLALFGVGAGPPLFGGIAPPALEWLFLALALLWFVNLTNFMDGLDLMAVAGIGAPMLVLALLAGLAAFATGDALLVAAATGGGLLAFAVFNRPPARLFLGDNGSLPAGLAAGVVFVALARETSVWAAWIPFGYFLVDATTTVFLRLARGSNIFAAHSEHAYQVAFRAGRSAPWIAARVVGVTLVAMALMALAARADAHPAVALIAAAALHLSLVAYFRFRSKPPIGRA